MPYVEEVLPKKYLTRRGARKAKAELEASNPKFMASVVKSSRFGSWQIKVKTYQKP